MSVLGSDVHNELSRLLELLQAADNDTRSTAEEHLATNWVQPRPQILLMGLVEQIAINPKLDARQFAAIIFRRISIKHRKLPSGEVAAMFVSLDPAEAYAIRSKLLEALGREENRSTRNKISDAVAEIARQYSENNQAWPELLEALFQLSLDGDAGRREAAFRIFSSAPGIIEMQHEATMVEAFSRGFKDETPAVRIAAMDAFSCFFRSIERDQQMKYFALMPEMLSILPPLKADSQSDDLSKAIASLTDLAEVCPKMFKPQFRNLVAFSISVVQDKELTDLCRQNALELMATFADVAPTMCRKDASYTNDMVMQCLSLMTDLGEDDDNAAEWLAQTDFTEDESDVNHVAGEQCMDRLANRLGGPTILGPTFNWLPRMMSSMAWRERHAALMAISSISEGCRELMIGELASVLNLVAPALSDEHPRVQWAGCNALGQMSTDFAPHLQKEHAATVLKALAIALESPHNRVKSHAAAALVNFCEEAEKETLEPYLDDLMSRLFQLLQINQYYVQEQALSTIATIADSAEVTFAKYYDLLMPSLMNVMHHENDKDRRLLKAKAMECATLIALAVGRERLGDDLNRLLQMLANIQQSVVEDDDPQIQYLMHCWGRMCRVMGMDFLPYLEIVVPSLLPPASAKADVQVLDDEDDAEAFQQDGWELLPLRGRTLGIRTSAMDDKCTAIELLVVYAQVLKDKFAPYVPRIMEEVAIPSLSFFFHDPVRSVAAKLVPLLLASYKERYGPTSNELRSLWASIIDRLLDVLNAEPAIATLAEMYQCFYEVVEVMGPGCLGDKHMELFISHVLSTLKEYAIRVKKRDEDRAIDGDDAEDIDEGLLLAIEDDETMLADINKAFHSVFKNMGAAFLPHWEALMSTYESMMSSSGPAQRQWALCIFDDVLEYCPEQSWNYHSLMMKPLAAGCTDSSPSIRQAAAYGIGMAAQKGGENWMPFVTECIPALLQSSTQPDSRSDDNIYATENATAAVAKILHNNRGAVPNRQAVIETWFSTLPVINDEEAAPHVYMFLAELVDQVNPYVVTKVEEVFMAVAQALETEVLRGAPAEKVVHAAKKLIQVSGINAASLLQKFSPSSQQIITSYFA